MVLVPIFYLFPIALTAMKFNPNSLMRLETQSNALALQN